MKPRIYDCIINVCIIITVTSAILFDRVGNFSWLAGGFGILAGITATVVYFYNQFHQAHQ